MGISTRLRSLALQSVVAAGRVLTAGQRLLVEMALTLYDEDCDRFLRDRYYERSPLYLNGENQRSGLFPYEARMLARFFPTPPAKLLLPGAGAGRELLALRDAGYSVDAFDANPDLAKAASKIAGDDAVRLATVQEWAATAQGQYAGVFTGWALWTHLLHQRDRLDALRAFRQVCPDGPVLLSFWRLEATLDHRERPVILQPLVPKPRSRFASISQTWVRGKVLRREPLERGTIFSTTGLFAHLVSETELVEEAGLTGYEVAYYERDGSRYPHAVLRPERGDPVALSRLSGF